MVGTGTFWRTVLAIATCINTALMATDITGFNNPTLEMIYKIASLVLNFVIVALVTYFNQDYTKEACVGTGTTRLLKAENKSNEKEFTEDRNDIEEDTEVEDE